MTDLTVDLNSGEGAGVKGGVIGASTDGSEIYFVANGVLAAGAKPGSCRWEAPPGNDCNLYAEHYTEGTEGAEGTWEAPELIARLSSEDSPDWGRFASNEISLKDKTSRVSPNGEYVAFMSNQPLTGYNNTDQKSGAADEEVFLYHRGAGITCVSCNPSGAQPEGVLDTEESGEGLGLLVDRPMTWSTAYVGIDHWLAGSVPGWTATGLQESRYQSRYLSNSGRIFFNSADSPSRGTSTRARRTSTSTSPPASAAARPPTRRAAAWRSSPQANPNMNRPSWMRAKTATTCSS